MTVSKDIISRQVAGEYILIPVGQAALSTQGIISLSESGYFLFEKLREDCTEDQLVKDMLEEYEVEEQVVRQDVHQFLDQMRALRLLQEDKV